MRLVASFLSCLLLLVPVLARADATDPKVTLSSGGLERSYLIHLPDPLPRGPLPLVVVLHGGGGSAEGTEKQTGFDAVADQHGFIAVYPNGTDRGHPLMKMMGKEGMLTWNAGTCCSYASEHNVDDVGFIRAVVADVEKSHTVDPKRVYATGISNGGMMSYRLACEASDLFAAIGPVSAVLEISPCRPTNPVAVVHIHGAQDENVPLKGGVGAKQLGTKEIRKPVQDTIDFWVKEDGCSTNAKSELPGVERVNYSGCAAGAEVDYYVIQDGGHAWPGGKQMAGFLDKPSNALDATSIIWDFFSKHAKP
ncbi:MAG: alpha/beta hydrolase family esterase [Bacillota bacterium]